MIGLDRQIKQLGSLVTVIVYFGPRFDKFPRLQGHCGVLVRLHINAFLENAVPQCGVLKSQAPAYFPRH